jgi:hypothetical protein
VAERIRGSVTEGTVPLGIERLLATLDGPAPAAGEAATAEDPAGFEDVLGRHPCVVLRAGDLITVADGLAALLGAGSRLLVAGDDPESLAGTRAALPPPMRALCLDEPLPLSDDEQRELRMLLLTETEHRRRRARQWFPPPELVLSPGRLAELGVAPPRPPAGSTGVELIPHLFGRLRPDRVDRLLAAARTCRDALRALAGKGVASWAWPLLERLSFGGDHAAFDSLLGCSAAVVSTAGALEGPAYRMVVVGVPPDAADRLTAHIEHLESGGSTRRFFASERQRSVTTLLRQLGLETTEVGDVRTLREALAAMELAGLMRRVSALCVELGVPEPTRTPAGVRRRHDELERLDEAARAVGTLRREVLFIHATSPVAVPDLAVAEAVATAVVGAAEALPRVRAELVEIADALLGPPGGQAAPEAVELATALRARSLTGYRKALRRLDSARAERAEQDRLASLLGQVRAVAPELAAAWRGDGARSAAYGTARLLSVASLLAEPPESPADVVVLLDGHRLPPEALLVAAAATRLVVVCPPGRDGAIATDSAAGALVAAGAPQIEPVAGGRQVEPVAGAPDGVGPRVEPAGGAPRAEPVAGTPRVEPDPGGPDGAGPLVATESDQPVPNVPQQRDAPPGEPPVAAGPARAGARG